MTAQVGGDGNIRQNPLSLTIQYCFPGSDLPADGKVYFGAAAVFGFGSGINEILPLVFPFRAIFAGKKQGGDIFEFTHNCLLFFTERDGELLCYVWIILRVLSGNFNAVYEKFFLLFHTKKAQ